MTGVLNFFFFENLGYLFIIIMILDKALLRSPGQPGTCYVTQTCLEFMILLLHFPSAGITDVHHHTCLHLFFTWQ
jgi:hypothetical protein